MPEQRSASYSLFSTCLWSFVSFFSSSSAVSGSRVLGGSPTDLLTWNIFRETHVILVLPKHCFMTPNSGGLLHKPKHFLRKSQDSTFKPVENSCCWSLVALWKDGCEVGGAVRKKGLLKDCFIVFFPRQIFKNNLSWINFISLVTHTWFWLLLDFGCCCCIVCRWVNVYISCHCTTVYCLRETKCFLNWRNICKT